MAGSWLGRRGLATLASTAALTLALAGSASPASTVTITMLANSKDQPAYQVLIPNFERAYPNITLNVTYVPTQGLAQAELTELAAGNAPDLLVTSSGLTSPISASTLAKAGDLAPMVKKPWATRKRSLPIVTSYSKVGPVLYTLTPSVNPFGIMTNDALFKKLGLSIPQTFSQLMTACQKAKAAGLVPININGGTSTSLGDALLGIALTTVYGPDPTWNAERKAGTVTFDGTAGWHQALQEFIDLDNAGCFEPGLATTTSPLGDANFVQGGTLMAATSASQYGTIQMLGPQFPFSLHPFPGGTTAGQTHAAIFLSGGIAVNAHSSAAGQAAAQVFVDFVARPKQDELDAELIGGVTQYDFTHDQLPSWMSSFGPPVASGKFGIDPSVTWWNGDVMNALLTDQLGLVTGQVTIDGLLTAMDTAWKEGPSS
jgi:raffinose/stachyose/melibiose transport system substrate-binding protein